MTRDSELSHPQALLQRFIDQQDIALSEQQIATLLQYCQLILRWNRLTSLVQSKSIVSLVEAHVIDCLAALSEVTGPNIVDVGSGAGLPGLVFAISKPSYHYYLIEANQRRTRFLTQVTIELSLDNVTVVNTRIEDWQPPCVVDCITARAYSQLSDFYQQCRHLLANVSTDGEPATGHSRSRSSTKFLALKGRIEADELAALPVSRDRIRVSPLSVPGREHRNLVIIE